MSESEGATTQAEATRETPGSAPWRLGSLAVAGGLAVSAIVHVALVGTVLFVSPKLLHPEPVDSVTVDLVTPEDLAAMSEKPDEPAAPATPETPRPPQPPQPPQPLLPQAQPSAPSPQSSPQSPPRSPPLDAFAMPHAPPQETPAAPAPPAPPIGEAARLAQLLGLPTPMAGLTSGGGPSESKANLTPEEIAEFSGHVQTCWTAPAGVAATSKLNVVIRVGLRRDGGLVAEPVLLAAPASKQGPPLVMSAMRTLQKCQPYTTLPAEKYDEWRLLDLRFSAGGMSTVSPVPSAQRTPAPPG
jgi:hypothetical protein